MSGGTDRFASLIMRSLYAQAEGKGQDKLLNRNLRMCTEEGLFATPFVIMAVPGNIFMAGLLTGVLGLGEAAYGAIVSLPAWFNAAQLLFIPFLARFFSARTLTITGGIAHAVLWIGMVVWLGYAPIEDRAALGRLLFVIFLVLSFFQSVNGVAWMSWIQEWIPGRVRGKYFGQRNRLIGLATVAFIALAGWATEAFGETVHGYQLILGAAAALRLVSMLLQTHIYTPWSQPEKLIHEGWRGQAARLKRQRGFLLFIGYSATFTFWVSFVGPFLPVFMRDYLAFPVTAQAHLLIITNLAAAFSMPIWGKIIDKHGCRAAIAVGMLLWMAQNYLWAVMTPELNWLLYPMWVFGGLVSGGVILGAFSLLLKLIPPELKMAGISLHLTATSLVGALAPILAGLLLNLFRGDGDNSVAWLYRTFFILYPTGCILGLLFLRDIKESQGAAEGSMLGAFRTLRQSLVQSGFVMMGNITLYRPIKNVIRKVSTKG